MAPLYEKTSSYHLNETDFSLRFLTNLFPAQIFIVQKLVKLLLPPDLFKLFSYWQYHKNINELLQIITKNLGREVGIVNRKIANFAPKYVDFQVFFTDRPKGDRHAHDINGYGQSFNSNNEGLGKAIGEFLERYFLAEDWKNDAFISTPAALGKRAVSLQCSPLYLEWQKNINPNFTTRKELDDTRLSWVRARSLLKMRSKYVPAQRVFWMRSRVSGEKIINHPTTNGNGGGFSSDEAILSALYELIERDSFMFHWFFPHSSTRINLESIDTPSLKKILPSVQKYKLDLLFLDITTTIGIPTILCVITDRADEDDIKISVGAACGYNPNNLFDKSLMEALVVQRAHWYSSQKDIIDTESKHHFFDSVGFDYQDTDRRIRFWRGKQIEKHIEFLRLGEEISFHQFLKRRKCKIFASSKQEFIFVKAVMRSVLQKYGENYHPYFYKVHNALLSKIGYSVVSVVIPNLFPLYMTEHRATLDIASMSHWEETANSLGIKWNGQIQNTYPHPFP